MAFDMVTTELIYRLTNNNYHNRFGAPLKIYNKINNALIAALRITLSSGALRIINYTHFK
jgi:hypothetical protein